MFVLDNVKLKWFKQIFGETVSIFIVLHLNFRFHGWFFKQCLWFYGFGMLHCCIIVELLDLFDLRFVDLFKKKGRRCLLWFLTVNMSVAPRYSKLKEQHLTRFFICI